ncbi:hypothetical protein [Francisella sp. TX07-6608]|uniref:hypothetical protein n=1 Tax=Francisella sp. TX07-6608 TaxID=573568 RepID=UPI0008F9D588|nr:hypothetical protein [Francisella sp. TX07-6608]OIN82962.1 hypothetical protein KX00_2103 [Francisella sp. TX07-6608]OIN85084.1 hypothetical protein KX00_2121 [Francisella sp. TX07-6608]
MIELETDTKFYHISIIEDLLGDLLVVCDYGSKLTKFVRRKNIHVASMSEATAVIDRIAKVRGRHGYVKVHLNFKDY